MSFEKGDRVQSLSNLYDKGTEDANGNVFSQRQLALGLGAYCFGVITWKFARRSREKQRYRVKWDDGSITQVELGHLEPVSVDADNDDDAGADIDEDAIQDQYVTVDHELTDDDEFDEEAMEAGEGPAIGEIVATKGGTCWERTMDMGPDQRADNERFDLQVCYTMHTLHPPPPTRDSPHHPHVTH